MKQNGFFVMEIRMCHYDYSMNELKNAFYLRNLYILMKNMYVLHAPCKGFSV